MNEFRVDRLEFLIDVLHEMIIFNFSDVCLSRIFKAEQKCVSPSESKENDIRTENSFSLLIHCSTWISSIGSVKNKISFSLRFADRSLQSDETFALLSVYSPCRKDKRINCEIKPNSSSLFFFSFHLDVPHQWYVICSLLRPSPHPKIDFFSVQCSSV